jgi:prevent-host-death family protein
VTTRTISSTTAQNHFGQILDDVIQNHTRYVVKRRGAPQAIVLNLSDFEQLLTDECERGRLGTIIRELRPVYDLGETVAQEQEA